MLILEELLSDLKYDKSPYYYTSERQFKPEIAHLFRDARRAGVHGVYVFSGSPRDDEILPPRPAVYIAQAENEEQAKNIHRYLWNLGYVPFLIILLPHQIRIYTGFDYSPQSEDQGRLDRDGLSLEEMRDLLRDFSAESIDSGQIWQLEKYEKKLDPNQRVDSRLLKNLIKLGDALEADGLNSEIAHALIGKYVYIRYLLDRDILSEEWLRKKGISKEDVFGRKSTVTGLSRLADALEERFNGKIFPLDFTKQTAPIDKHIAWTASVFMGDAIKSTDPEFVRQLSLDFQAYDFQYIPVEILSAIYEQFIEEKEEKGAIYTPEILADYVLSELDSVKRLEKGMKILDPSCGSGVFLVLAYRRLIEIEMARKGRKLQPEELLEILLESIYGVERELDACYVAEFSLILTLLHYLENPDFKFPPLHDNHIFQCDFFDDNAKFWGQSLQFDWITGNPPWIKADQANQNNARLWMSRNRKENPVTNLSVAEAFSWRVTDLLSEGGVVGLIMPATSLVNLKKNYRQTFFQKHEVVRITNFANLRDVLFDQRGTFPAATLVYRKVKEEQEKQYITHCGPFAINQISGVNHRPWVITINESEIQFVSPSEAEQGETSVWKLALWGTHRDKRAIERLRSLFPTTLEEFCEKRGWGNKIPRQGAEFCDDPNKPKAHIKGKKWFNTPTFNKIKPQHLFSIPDEVFQTIEEDVFIRRGEYALNRTTSAPHIILSAGWDFIIYSAEDFIIPPRQMGIAGRPQNAEDAEYLRALSVYLNSSLVAYYLFFHVPEWGIFRQRDSVVVTEVRKIPTPDFTPEQVSELAALQRELAEEEQREIFQFISNLQKEPQTKLYERSATVPLLEQRWSKQQKEQISQFDTELHARLQKNLDGAIFDIFNIPEDIATLSREFVHMRLQLDKGQAGIQQVTRKPNEEELAAYAHTLRNELDEYVMGTAHHQITMAFSDELIECTIEITDRASTIPIRVEPEGLTKAQLLNELSSSLKQQVSQWVYVRRGLRVFDGRRIYIYKSPRLIDWTQTQALNDANEIIGQILSTGMSVSEELAA